MYVIRDVVALVMVFVQGALYVALDHEGKFFEVDVRYFEVPLCVCEGIAKDALAKVEVFWCFESLKH